jgi:enterochelin esterase-like enzyme
MIRPALAYLLVFFSFFFKSLAGQAAEGALAINLSFSEEVLENVKPQGRLFLFLSQNPAVEPRTQVDPFPGSRTHIFARNFTEINSDQELLLNNSLEWAKTPEWSLENIPQGEYYLQILWDQNTTASSINAAGNLHSTKQKVLIDGSTKATVIINEAIAEQALLDNPLLKLVDFKSDTLSTWWQKSTRLKAAVLLPSGYDPNKAYPIRYNVAGYGGSYYRVNRLIQDADFMSWWNSDESPNIINVFLDGEGPFGDSYQMDSENSGPYGYALIYELMPHLEATFRGTNTPRTRFVDGCSTGGWVSLGLQLHYPAVFNGCFSYSPDAVEFENYQLINIYQDENAFVNEFGYLRPVMRFTDGEPVVSMKKFVTYENVLGRSNTYVTSGGQFSAHTALYSPKGSDGLPIPLFHPTTGAINRTVAEHWKKYDFKLYAQENWKTLGPQLAGKVYVWMGDMDHFYLNQATRAFAEFMQSTSNPKSDAFIEFQPTAGHCSQYSDRVVLEQMQQRLQLINAAQK